jgi:uncharacterized protein involved in exopolysaccharide biosynthesis
MNQLRDSNRSRERDVPATERAEKSEPEDGFELRELLDTIWSGRLVIMIVTLTFVAVGGAYAFLATEWYQADVVLSPAGKKSLSGGLAQLGGLASLAGIDIPSAGGGEPLAVLKSKSFAREFIEDRKLMPILFSDKWDAKIGDWKVIGKDQPDVRDGVKYFDEKVRTVSEDKKAGLVTLSIRWKDGAVAAEWANVLVKRLNDRLRKEAIQEAQSSIDYLQKEMLATTVVSLQQSIGRVLEGEMQKMALARANEDFAFKVVDTAATPKYRIYPKRLLVIAVAALLGFIAGITYVVAAGALKTPAKS